MPHIPGHVETEPVENVVPEGASFLMPDEPEDTGVVSPGQIADAPDVLGPSVSSQTTFSVEEFMDLIQGTSTDPNKPLGKNFQKVYKVEVGEIGKKDLVKKKILIIEIAIRRNSAFWSFMTALILGIGCYNYYTSRLLVLIIAFY